MCLSNSCSPFPLPQQMADFTASYASAIAAKRLTKTLPVGSIAHGVAVTAMHAANAIYFDDRLRILFPAEWAAKEARAPLKARAAEEVRVTPSELHINPFRNSELRAKMIRLGLVHLLPPPPLVSMDAPPS